MKKILCLLSALWILSCIPRKEVEYMRSEYSDTLSRVREALWSEQEDNDLLQKAAMRFREQNREYEALISMYQDSLGSLREVLLALGQDTLAPYRLWQENQVLNQSLSQKNEQVKKLSKDRDYFKSLEDRQIREIETLKDSLRVLNSMVKSSYASPFNYTKELRVFQNVFDCYIVNLKKSQLQLFWKNPGGQTYRTFKRVQHDLSKDNKTLIFATNAGMFTNKNAPQGLYIENGRLLRPLILEKKGYGNFFMQPNGVFSIDHTGRARVQVTDAFHKMADSVVYATQSGPMLLTGGKIHDYFTPGSKNRYIRSGVGVIGPHQIVFIISRKPVNFYDFARLFRDYFQCKNALYLDGAISKMFLPEMGRYDLGGDFGPIIGIYK